MTIKEDDQQVESLRRELLVESLTDRAGDEELRGAIEWLDGHRARPSMRAELVPLAEALGPAQADEALAESVVFVRTTLREREVKQWTQPLMISRAPNLCGLILAKRDGRHWALMQAVEEPGVAESVEIGPTLQLGMSFAPRPPEDQPFLAEFTASEDSLLFKVGHSEEGGRFFRDRIDYAALLAEEMPEPPSDRYRWLPITALKHAIEHPNLLNIHARTLLCMVA